VSGVQAEGRDCLAFRCEPYVRSVAGEPAELELVGLHGLLPFPASRRLLVENAVHSLDGMETAFKTCHFCGRPRVARRLSEVIHCTVNRNWTRLAHPHLP
jgi:hypothetical protein